MNFSDDFLPLGHSHSALVGTAPHGHPKRGCRRSTSNLTSRRNDSHVQPQLPFISPSQLSYLSDADRQRVIPYARPMPTRMHFGSDAGAPSEPIPPSSNPKESKKIKKQDLLEKRARDHALLATFSGRRLFYRENPQVKRPQDELDEFLGIHPAQSKAIRGGYGNVGLVNFSTQWYKLPDFEPLLGNRDGPSLTSSVYNSHYSSSNSDDTQSNVDNSPSGNPSDAPLAGTSMSSISQVKFRIRNIFKS